MGQKFGNNRTNKKKKLKTLGMKNVYLNRVLISRLYLQTIHKTKNTTKIIIIKIKKKYKKYKDKERRIIPFKC
jgi:hypothetical protein